MAGHYGSWDETGPRLEPRERQILWLLCEGKVGKVIAAELGLSPETVRWYLKRIYSKLGVHNVVEAIAVARRLGLIEEPLRLFDAKS